MLPVSTSTPAIDGPWMLSDNEFGPEIARIFSCYIWIIPCWLFWLLLALALTIAGLYLLRRGMRKSPQPDGRVSSFRT